MKQIIPEIYVRDAARAIEFYKHVFDGQIKNIQMSDDLDMFQDMPGKLIHAELHVDRCVMYFVDVFEPLRSRVGNVTIMLHMSTRHELERVFSQLAVGGQVGMEPQETFWGAVHAIVTDRFGAPWALNYSDKS